METVPQTPSTEAVPQHPTHRRPGGLLAVPGGRGIASFLNTVEKGTRGQAAGKGPTKGFKFVLDASQGRKALPAR